MILFFVVVVGYRCYLASCDQKNVKAEDQVPEAFDHKSFENHKFVLAYKQLGPPREKFHPGTSCDEEFANASKVADRGTGSKKRKKAGLSRDRIREVQAKKHKQALAEAVVERREMEATSQEHRMFLIGKSHATQKYLRSVSADNHRHMKLMMEFHALTSNADMKATLEKELMKKLMAKPMTYAAAEGQLYGTASAPIPVDDVATPELLVSTPGSTQTPGSGDTRSVSAGASRARRAVDLDDTVNLASDDSEDEGDSESEDMDDIEVMQCRSIMHDIIVRSGYVVIKNVIPLVPDQDEWFAKLKEDVLALKDTNNMVPIFNGRGARNDKKRHQLLFHEFDVTSVYPGMSRRPDSDPEVLGRVDAFLKDWYGYIRRKLESLKIITKTRKAGNPLLLVSLDGCKRQKLHWDYPPNKVQALIAEKQYDDVPVSVLTSFTPKGSGLVIKDAKGSRQHVKLPFGAMIVFTGDVLHAGESYKEFNLRGFMHVENKDVLAFKTDEVFQQLQPQVPVSDRQTRSTSTNANARVQV